MNEVHLKEAEQEALAGQALADFASREGITLPAAGQAPLTAAETAPAGKSMGPGQTA